MSSVCADEWHVRFDIKRPMSIDGGRRKRSQSVTRFLHSDDEAIRLKLTEELGNQGHVNRLIKGSGSAMSLRGVPINLIV